MGEYEATRTQEKRKSSLEKEGRKAGDDYGLKMLKTMPELVYSRDRQEQIAPEERQEEGKSVPVVQRVADIAEIALEQAYRKILQLYGPIQGSGSKASFVSAMRGWNSLGFSQNIFPELTGFRAFWFNERECRAYFEACIRRFYTPGYPPQPNCPQVASLTGIGLGTDQGHYGVGGAGSDSLLGRDLAHRNNPHNLKPELSVIQPGRPGSVEQILSNVLSSPFFVNIFASWRNDALMPHFMTFTANAVHGITRPNSFVHGRETANKMAVRTDLQLPRLSYQNDNGMPSLGSYRSIARIAGNEAILYNNLPDQYVHGVRYKQRTTRRTFVHEHVHHLEQYLGVEELANMYRFLYARTSNLVYPDGLRGVALPRGVRRHGTDKFKLDMYRPALTPPLPPDIGDRQTAQNYADGYMGTDSTYKRRTAGGADIQPERHGTEFLSTTAEMLSSNGLAARLIQTDPMRVALFLKLANPPVYRFVAGQFNHQYNSAPPVPPGGAPVPAPPHVTLDQLLHFT